MEKDGNSHGLNGWNGWERIFCGRSFWQRRERGFRERRFAGTAAAAGISRGGAEGAERRRDGLFFRRGKGSEEFFENRLRGKSRPVRSVAGRAQRPDFRLIFFANIQYRQNYDEKNSRSCGTCCRVIRIRGSGAGVLLQILRRALCRAPIASEESVHRQLGGQHESRSI